MFLALLFSLGNISTLEYVDKPLAEFSNLAKSKVYLWSSTGLGKSRALGPCAFEFLPGNNHLKFITGCRGRKNRKVSSAEEPLIRGDRHHLPPQLICEGRKRAGAVKLTSCQSAWAASSVGTAPDSIGGNTTQHSPTPTVGIPGLSVKQGVVVLI